MRFSITSYDKNRKSGEFQFTFSNEDNFHPISLAKEMGAYEAIWSEPNVSFKSIAKRFNSPQNTLPSDFVSLQRIEQYKSEALKLLKTAGIGRFGICLNGTCDYPKRLLDAKHPIGLFYYQGNWDLVSSPSVSVIGTRNPTEAGKRRTRKLVRFLVREDLTITSGLARGIDTVAHQTSLEEGGKTMAVIGTPLNEYYPKENKSLQEYLSNKFLVISPVPFVRYSKQKIHHNKLFFPERNKLMSAITKATIIVEASERSGTLVQARAAIDQGRKLFILNSCFQNPTISWPDKFARLGAVRVKNFDDIMEHLII